MSLLLLFGGSGAPAVVGVGNFADFIAWPDRQEIVIAELTPGLTLSGFDAVGGAGPNSYQLLVSRFTQTSVIQGGLYRRVVDVRENGVSLDAMGNLGQVDGNPGSWFWDESAAGGLLYVRTTGGGDPDTYTAYQALVTFYVSTAPVVLDAGFGGAPVYYHPWLTGELPTSVQEIEDLVYGHKSVPGGSLTLTNAHKAWNAIVATDGNYVWTNKTARVLVGGVYNNRALSYSSYVAMATLLVDDIAADEQLCTIALKPLASLTELQLPVTPFFEASYPTLGEGVRGTHKALIYGRVTCRPPLTDASGYGSWTICDAAYQTLYAFHAAWAIDKSTGARYGLTDGIHYAQSLTTCTIIMLDIAYHWQNFDLEVEVTGKPGGTRGYLSTFGEIVQDILQTHLGVPTSQIDTAAFAQASLDAPEELAVYLKDRRSFASILSTAEEEFASLEGSVLGTVQQTLSGLWTCWIWDPRYDASTVPTLRKEDFALFRMLPKIETVYTTVRVHHNQNHVNGDWSVYSLTDTRRQYLTGSRERLDRWTYLRQPSDAEALTYRVTVIASVQATEVEFQERGAKLAQAVAGDTVLVTFDPAPTVAGSYSSRPFEILRLEKSYSPQLTVLGLLGDRQALALEFGEWTDASAPAWASASAAQRDSQGFWSDAAGQTDSGDVTTLNQSLWM